MSAEYVPAFIRDYLEFTADSEPCEAFRLWSCIAILSAACESRLILRYGIKQFLLNKYVILAGSSGSRKSEAIGQALRVYTKVEGLAVSPDAVTERSIKDCIQYDKDERGNLVERIKSCQLSDQEEPFEYHSILLQAPELKDFIGKSQEGIIPFLTRIYDSDFSDEWHYQTGHMGSVRLKRPSIAILGGTTVEWLSESLPASAIGGGFTARCHFILGKLARKVPFPQSSDAYVRQEQKMISHLRAIAQRSGYINWSPQAADWFTEWYQNFEPPLDCDPVMVPWYARYQVHLMKVAAISVVADFRKHLLIEVKDLEWADKELKKIAKNMHMVFGGIGSNKLANVQSKLEQLLKESKRPVTKSQLFKQLRRDASPMDITKLLDEMVRAGMVRTKIVRGQAGYYIAKEEL